MIRILQTTALAIALVLAACDRSTPKAGPAAGDKDNSAFSSEASRIHLTEAEIELAGIRIEKIMETEIHQRISVTATIQANQDRLAHVAPRVSGRIVAIAASLGDRVKAGQTLARLDSIELGDAHSAYLQAESQYKLAQSDFERAETLYADQIVPQKDYLRSRAEQEKARASLRAATDKLRLMGVAPARTENAVSVFPVSAPFTGTVIEKKAVLGELVQPDSSLFTVADLSMVWIEANLFEKDLGKVRTGASVGVTVSAYPDEVFKGRLTYISSVMDKESRTIAARVEVPNADGRLKPDMFATAAIDMTSAGKALTVPASAVLMMEGKKAVFVQAKEGFEQRVVELGDNLGGRFAVKDGIEENDVVVVEGAYTLKARRLKSKIGDHD